MCHVAVVILRHGEGWVFLKDMMYYDTAFHNIQPRDITEHQRKSVLEGFSLPDTVIAGLNVWAGHYIYCLALAYVFDSKVSSDWYSNDEVCPLKAINQTYNINTSPRDKCLLATQASSPLLSNSFAYHTYTEGKKPVASFKTKASAKWLSLTTMIYYHCIFKSTC